MAGLFDFGPKELPGLFGGVKKQVTDPLFLGGAGLLAGGGWQGAMQGAQMGAGIQEQERESAQRQQLAQAYPGLLSQQTDPQTRALLQASGPEKGIDFLTKLALEKQKAAADGRYSKSGSIFQGQDGKYYSWQGASDGQNLVKPIGDGMTPFRGTETVAGPTETRIINKATGGDVRSIPKDVAGAASATAQGEAAGKARVDLPRVQAMHGRLIRQIEDVERNDLGRVTGWMGHLPTVRPESVDVEEKASQLTGGAFLQAFEALKGGGQITEIEGAKATAALARLANFKQSEAGYRQALKDFKFEVQELLSLARTKAGTSAAPQDGEAPAAAPDPDGWSDVGGVRIREKR